MEKRDIRKMVKERRLQMPEEARMQKSRQICDQVLCLPEFAASDVILIYMDCKGEVSTRPLIEKAWGLGKKVAAPKVEGENMRYFYISSYAEVADGYFHVPEPIDGLQVCGAEAEQALLIVPGVGFDRNRNRCGYGKGFYDRYLAAHPKNITVGIAFDFQIVDEVPVRPEDICPRYLITETLFLARQECIHE